MGPPARHRLVVPIPAPGLSSKPWPRAWPRRGRTESQGPGRLPGIVCVVNMVSSCSQAISRLSRLRHWQLADSEPDAFPYGVRYKNGTFRSWFCTEKPHSMTHWADNYSTAGVGRIRIISTSVSDGVPDELEDGRQDPVAEDQQPGLVRRQPPQEQHGGGGGDGAAAAPGRNRCAPSLHHLCISLH